MTAANLGILLAEDDPDEVFFLEEAFSQIGMSGALRVVQDGEEALEYLQGHGVHADRRLYPLPSLILLDLTLPRKSGLEVLAWCRRQPGLKSIPIIMLSSSQSNRDLERAYELGANSCLVKPIVAAEQLEMVKVICKYWVVLNKVPDIAIPR